MGVRLSSPQQHLKHKSSLNNDFRRSKMSTKLKKHGLAKRTEELLSRDRPRFFDQVGHQTTNAESIGNKHFLLNNDLVRLTKIMNNLVKDLKILSFKVIFQCLKLVKFFKKKNLMQKN